MISILFAIFIPLILFDMLTPHVIRKTTVFGISIPEPFVDDDKLKDFKRKYSLTIALLQIPIVTTLIFISLSFDEIVQSFIMVAGIFLYMFISIGVYLKFHFDVRNYKRKEQWEEQIQVVRVSSFETKFDKETRRFPHWLFIPGFFIIIGVIVWITYIYPELPDVIPTHWGIDGQPDAWSDKSFFSVYAVTFIMLFEQCLIYGLSYGIFHSSVQLKAQQSELSLQREHEMRKLNAEIMAFINIIALLFLAVIDIRSFWGILQGDNSLSILYLTPIFLILIFASIYYYMKRSKALNEQFKDLDGLESSPGDDEHWKWGMFYFNKDNPDLFVEKKFGVGFTVNFARPAVWIFLILITVVPLLPIFFM